MKLSIWSSYYVDLSPEDAILEIAGERHAPVEIRGYKLQYIKQCMEYMENK